MMCMLITYMKCRYIHITSSSPLFEIWHIQLYTPGKMNTFEVTFGTVDIEIIPPH